MGEKDIELERLRDEVTKLRAEAERLRQQYQQVCSENYDLRTTVKTLAGMVDRA